MIGVYDERPPRKVKRGRWTGENAEDGDHPPRRPGEEKRITPPAPARPTAARVPAPGAPLTRRSHRDRPREPPRKGVVQATLRWVPGASGASLLSLPYRFGSSMMQPCDAVALSTRHQICSQRHRLQGLPQRRHTRCPRRRRRSTWPLPCAGICCRRIYLNALKRLDDGELASLLAAALDEAKRRGRPPSSLAASASDNPTPQKKNESSRVRPAHVAVLSLTRGQVNAVRAAFKAGIAPPRIAREFGISQSEVGRCWPPTHVEVAT